MDTKDNKRSLPPQRYNIILLQHDVKQVNISPLMLLYLPPPLLVNVLLADLVLHQGRKPIQQVQYLLLLLVQRLLQGLDLVVGNGKLSHLVPFQLLDQRLVVDHDLTQVVVILLSGGEVLALSEVLLLTDHRKRGGEALVEDAFLAPEVSALDDAAPLALVYVLE